jgi:hypothetical protein
MLLLLLLLALWFGAVHNLLISSSQSIVSINPHYPDGKRI